MGFTEGLTSAPHLRATWRPHRGGRLPGGGGGARHTGGAPAGGGERGDGGGEAGHFHAGGGGACLPCRRAGIHWKIGSTYEPETMLANSVIHLHDNYPKTYMRHLTQNLCD
eukprot:896281-Prorocentrum_minimum.AAC.1